MDRGGRWAIWGWKELNMTEFTHTGWLRVWGAETGKTGKDEETQEGLQRGGSIWDVFQRQVLFRYIKRMGQESDERRHWRVSVLGRSWLSCDPTDSSPAGSSVHRIIRARVLEWVAMSFTRGSSCPRTERESPMSPALAGRFFTSWCANYNRRVVPVDQGGGLYQPRSSWGTESSVEATQGALHANQGILDSALHQQ